MARPTTPCSPFMRTQRPSENGRVSGSPRASSFRASFGPGTRGRFYFCTACRVPNPWACSLQLLRAAAVCTVDMLVFIVLIKQPQPKKGAANMFRVHSTTSHERSLASPAQPQHGSLAYCALIQWQWHSRIPSHPTRGVPPKRQGWRPGARAGAVLEHAAWRRGAAAAAGRYVSMDHFFAGAPASLSLRSIMRDRLQFTRGDGAAAPSRRSATTPTNRKHVTLALPVASSEQQALRIAGTNVMQYRQ
ncbi:hypothetical protein BS78_04G215600 [Paspalum vaginatum]|nr:hypothetical protein BS78_04G215600 [Paspalum vaginatum]